MDSMDDVRKFLNKPEEYHPLPNGKFTDGFGNMLDAHSVVYAITAERDRLAAENKQLAIDYELSVKSRNWQYDAHIACKNELAAANATLDRLREAIRRQHAELFYVTAAQELRVGFDVKKETTNVRDTAAAHGFDAMPDDLAQRSVDSETNYVRLNPENET